MSGSKVSIGDMADAIMKELNEYADATSEDVKNAVKNAAKTVRTEIQNSAPVKTGAYRKSWSIKTMSETSQSLNVTVHSRNRYQLAHLLERGHAKRGGGRTPARPHIAPAEQIGIEQLERDIERSLKNG